MGFGQISWHFGQFCCSFEALILKFKGLGLQFVFSEDIFVIFLAIFAFFWGMSSHFGHFGHWIDQIVYVRIFMLLIISNNYCIIEYYAEYW